MDNITISREKYGHISFQCIMSSRIYKHGNSQNRENCYLRTKSDRNSERYQHRVPPRGAAGEPRLFRKWRRRGGRIIASKSHFNRGNVIRNRIYVCPHQLTAGRAVSQGSPLSQEKSRHQERQEKDQNQRNFKIYRDKKPIARADKDGKKSSGLLVLTRRETNSMNALGI